ncbi:hypothetical protein TeGR_g8441 [Tetraparma gracilis]|uniref:Uncharacterized protein n=1 Tax=Tetraparma gracilis TaxID=2962635 RepID=A0ABQ6MZA0_9STRA|nr:hypothetical protein TeGR_g8441 [Tetraparma gracilis]
MASTSPFVVSYPSLASSSASCMVTLPPPSLPSLPSGLRVLVQARLSASPRDGGSAEATFAAAPVRNSYLRREAPFLGHPLPEKAEGDRGDQQGGSLPSPALPPLPFHVIPPYALDLGGGGTGALPTPALLAPLTAHIQSLIIRPLQALLRPHLALPSHLLTPTLTFTLLSLPTSPSPPLSEATLLHALSLAASRSLAQLRFNDGAALRPLLPPGAPLPLCLPAVSPAGVVSSTCSLPSRDPAGPDLPLASCTLGKLPADLLPLLAKAPPATVEERARPEVPEGGEGRGRDGDVRVPVEYVEGRAAWGV